MKHFTNAMAPAVHISLALFLSVSCISNAHQVGFPDTGTSTSPQQITWMYVNKLDAGGDFLGNVLGLREVMGLVQRHKCRIFQVTSSQNSFLGVCDTRTPPSCTPQSMGNSVPSTYTLVFTNRTEVDLMASALKPFNGTRMTITEPSGSSAWGAYGFNFYDLDIDNGLGCYRFEVQSFDDSAWVSDTLTPSLQGQLRKAGPDIYGSPPLKTGPVQCKCADFCSGMCFAPSCEPCPSHIWTTEDDCLNPGPLGGGLLCLGQTTEPCCSPNGTACTLGNEWCNCRIYTPRGPLFPPLHRTFDPVKHACSEEI